MTHLSNKYEGYAVVCRLSSHYLFVEAGDDSPFIKQILERDRLNDNTLTIKLFAKLGNSYMKDIKKEVVDWVNFCLSKVENDDFSFDIVHTRQLATREILTMLKY